LARPHGKIEHPPTPKIKLSQLDWLPHISLRAWLDHTGKMLIVDWFPLTLFTMAIVFAPRDHHGCHYYA